MMNSSGLRRKDTTKGPPLRILSLDGGGVRGYSMLILLQELMHRTFVEIEGRAPKRHELPKPCDHFDLIAGTGTGGLIAIMLGRLRMDVETCKDMYVRMTKKVFETDKTIAGIPYRSTLFKASKLEEAIKECVIEHTSSETEGIDEGASTYNMSPPLSPVTAASSVNSRPYRSQSNASRYSQIGMTPSNPRLRMGHWRGNPNALLYDTRESRTKTAVAAVFRGTPRNGSAILLRSYDSRKEPAPDTECTIWQAGRATSATGLAFKPIKIGQHVFLDEGAGKYNPSPQILDEAVCNEWPGRDVGVFVSVGTGKRPAGTNNQQHLWWEDFVSSNMGDFAEARRRLAAKIEGSEETHQQMLRDHLARRQVNPENYFRLNVEVGVGEFGMNEWNRLSDISTNTRMYLSRNEVQSINYSAASKIAKIHRAKVRFERSLAAAGIDKFSFDLDRNSDSDIPSPPSNPLAVELPAEVTPNAVAQHMLQKQQQSLLRPANGSLAPSISSDEYPQPVIPDQPAQQTSAAPFPAPQRPADRPVSRRSDPQHPTFGSGRVSESSLNNSPRMSGEHVAGSHAPHAPPGQSPPPRPPKTPLNQRRDASPAAQYPPSVPQLANLSRPPQGIALPYPDTDGPPPMVNTARKPEFGVR